MVEEGSSFEAAMAARSAADYADFLMPHLAGDPSSSTWGGIREISVGIAPMVGHVVGVDLEEEEFAAARAYARDRGIANIEFRTGACTSSICATSTSMSLLVIPCWRRSTGRSMACGRSAAPSSPGVSGLPPWNTAASTLAGPDEPLLRRSYAIREQLWLLDVLEPYRGRRLRGLLTKAGFERVEVTTKYVCYGTPERAKSFGPGRAEDCLDEVQCERGPGRTDSRRLESSAPWSTPGACGLESPDAYAAFAWCRGIG